MYLMWNVVILIFILGKYLRKHSKCRNNFEMDSGIKFNKTMSYNQNQIYVQ